MAAFGDATLTIDTGEMTYIDRLGNPHVVNNAETIVFDLTATNTTEAVYTVKTDDGLVCTDGTTLTVEKDPTFTKLHVKVDATAALYPIAGTLTFIEDAEAGGARAIWDIRTVTIDDVDEPTALTQLIAERRDNPQVTMTLTTVTMSQ